MYIVYENYFFSNILLLLFYKVIDVLDITIESFFNEEIYQYPRYIEYILKYKRIKYTKNNYLKKYQELINTKEINITINNIKHIIKRLIT